MNEQVELQKKQQLLVSKILNLNDASSYSLSNENKKERRKKHDSRRKHLTVSLDLTMVRLDNEKREKNEWIVRSWTTQPLESLEIYAFSTQEW